MEKIQELIRKGFEQRIIVDFLIGESEKRKLTIKERSFIGDYIIQLENINNYLTSIVFDE